MQETQFEKIMRKTGRNPSECKCKLCSSQCKTPCLGTPEDIAKLVDAGYSDQLAPTVWLAGMVMGVIDRPVNMIQPMKDEEKGTCTFFNNGICELHEKGLKPTEGRLSHHTLTEENYNGKKSLTWNVAKTWIQ